ncbi:hypothetical protein BCR32DRAFT_196878, partial [Anaeromyces robustus]
CWSTSLGYSCCSYSTQVFFTDDNGKWSVENDEWCGIVENEENNNCWSAVFGYPCCKYTKVVRSTDENGDWGIEYDHWCGIPKS